MVCATAYPALVPTLDELLHAAVGGVGGTERPGQVEMAHAVADAIDGKGHLLVQAGTGTGKSLAYLVPAVRHAMDSGTPTVVATATLALQAQIVDRDMPRLAESLAPLLGRRPTYALVKGRRNYLCAHKLEGGFPDDDVDTLMSVGAVDQQASRLGAEVVRLRDWAEVTESGDRDELVPGVSERAWRQVSVSRRGVPGRPLPDGVGVLRRALARGRPRRRRHRHQPLVHGDRRLRGPPDAARARRARRRRGPRARRPGHLHDHRRGHARHDPGRGQAGRAAVRLLVDDGRGRRPARVGARAGARGAAAPASPTRSVSPCRGCATRPARCRPS